MCKRIDAKESKQKTVDARTGKMSTQHIYTRTCTEIDGMRLRENGCCVNRFGESGRRERKREKKMRAVNETKTKE